MKIGFDLRSLSSGTVSGVENYCVNLLHNLLHIDNQNEYLLFLNSFKNKNGDFGFGDFNYINSQTKQTRVPSKILNLAFMLGLKKVEDFIGEIDWLFMPNLNQFSIKPQTKLAITVHDLSPIVTPEFYNLKRKIWHKFLNYKKAFNRANVLFAVSENTKNDLIKIFNIDPKKIVTAYPATSISLNSYQVHEETLREARSKYNLPGDYILFLNTIEPRKNLAGLIKAFEKINSNTYLVIAGRLGWKYKKDFELIKNSKKFAKIKYVGYVEENFKPALIKMAQALVYPSFYEGFGFQALEAMALNTPVVASQVTSLPEVAGGAAVLINPYDLNSLTNGLESILTDKNLRNILIEKGAKQAQNFSWDKTAKLILENLK
jgi:glycosyltransferase involved in cell wall biosynthesis